MRIGKLKGLWSDMKRDGFFLKRVIRFREWKLHLFNRLCLGRDTHIDPSARIMGMKYITLGKNFKADKGFWLHAVDTHGGQMFKPRIIIGDDVSFGDWCHVGATHLVRIGNHVLFGSKCYVTDHNHGIYTGDACSHPDTPPAERPLTADSYVIIEDNVWVGDGVAILPGVTVGRGAIIATNAVVTKDIPPYTICAGIPARPIKKWDEEKGRWVKYNE